MHKTVRILFFILFLFACTRTTPRTSDEEAAGSALVSVDLNRQESISPGAPGIGAIAVQLITGGENRSTVLDMHTDNAVQLFTTLTPGYAEIRIGLPDDFLLEYEGARSFIIQEDTTTPLFIRLEQHRNIMKAVLHTQGRLVLWSTLDSASSITHPAFGPAGTITGGGFTPGKFGNCYTASHNENLQVSFPGAVITANRGCIEFWAKLEGYDPARKILNEDWLAFFQCRGGWIEYFFMIGINDGMGGGGLCFHADNGDCATGNYTTDDSEEEFTLEKILGAGETENWHHYAVCWDIEGIPGLSSIAQIFLDGSPHSTSLLMDSDKNPTRLDTPENIRLGFIENSGKTTFTSGRVYIDNLKIWSFAKTDFSDREQEGL